MSAELSRQLDAAKELEKDRKCAKRTEAAFGAFISKYESAEDDVQDRFKSHLPFAYNSRGLARYLQVEFRLAVCDFSKAIELNPNVPNFYYNRGLIKFRLKDFDAAEKDLHQTLALDSHHNSAKLCLNAMEEMIRVQGNTVS